VGVTLSAVVLLLGADPEFVGPTLPELPAVTAARTRQSAVRSLDVEFTHTDQYAKGGSSMAMGFSPKSGVPVPAEPTTFESRNRLVIDGDKIRFENNHFLVTSLKRKLSQTTMICCFDGTTSNAFYPHGFSGTEEPLGVVAPSRRPDKLDSTYISPILLAFRGLNPVFITDSLTGLKPAGTTLVIDGATCEEYSIARRNKEPLRLWLDPARDYVIRRVRDLASKTNVIQYDIQYRRDDACGWVPTGWTRTSTAPDGTPFITSTVEVMSMRFNEAQPPGRFEITFPPGTRVTRGTTDYRVQPDGSTHEINPAGEGAQPEPRRGAWYWLAIATVALMLMPYAWVRGLRKRRERIARRAEQGGRQSR
jgi:hypothetical protein